MNARALLGRRLFLGGVGSLALACGGASPKDGAAAARGGSAAEGGGAGGGGSVGPGGGLDASGAPMSCTPTADNILGPYYRQGAPFARDLTTADMPGTRFDLSGRVLTPECEPIAGAVLDFWQADDGGSYDNDGGDDPPNGEYVLRGKVETAADGSYSLRTIVPGRYLNGDRYRPAHIHVTVSAAGFPSLTTQLYFEGDPYNESDPFVVEALIMKVRDVGDEKAGTFDFVLRSA